MASRVPEMPHDKTYHIFVCYEKNSVDIVRIIVDNLENKGIMCCYYDRDFTPGRSIIENMYEAIEKSLYMLIVLSEDFENSHFCKDELDKASHLRAKGEYNMIPIRIEPCSVPECLRYLVYIDVEDSIDRAHVKIIDAMSKKELRIEFREDRNGEYLQFEMQAFAPRLKFTETDTAEIWNNRFEVSADLLQEIETTVNSSSFVKYQHIIEHPYCAIFLAFLHLLILLMILFLALLLNTGREKAGSFQPVEYCLAVG
ncbi:stimulator of interferon genes protein-like [Mercenaria mercenaria]|uniref:stimulator of interferon genes protein-like n=1 Tax=Mercenaria mercenaria TaxID=6596 RepID=UPI00234F514C|nr:stimulator of interferon genes protein-like [Mercenaria mercenaria]